jgi:hypothetical protein
MAKNPASDTKPLQSQQSQTFASGSQSEAVHILDASVKILTAEDIIDITKNAPVKILKINHPCKVTDFAETKAAELGITIESNG